MPQVPHSGRAGSTHQPAHWRVRYSLFPLFCRNLILRLLQWSILRCWRGVLLGSYGGCAKRLEDLVWSVSLSPSRPSLSADDFLQVWRCTCPLSLRSTPSVWCVYRRSQSRQSSDEVISVYPFDFERAWFLEHPVEPSRRSCLRLCTLFRTFTFLILPNRSLPNSLFAQACILTVGIGFAADRYGHRIMINCTSFYSLRSCNNSHAFVHQWPS